MKDSNIDSISITVPFSKDRNITTERDYVIMENDPAVINLLIRSFENEKVQELSCPNGFISFYSDGEIVSTVNFFLSTQQFVVIQKHSFTCEISDTVKSILNDYIAQLQSELGSQWTPQSSK